jgi:hypothetical protein
MVALKLGALHRAQKATTAMQGQKTILGEKEGMAFTDALPFHFHIKQVCVVVFADLLIVIPEVAFDAVLLLQLQVSLLDAFQEGGVIPGGAVVDDGAVGGGPHRLKFLGVFVGINVLGLIDLEEEVGGVADYIRGNIGREKNGTGVSETNDVTHLGRPGTTKIGLIQSVFEARHGDNGLGLKVET